MMIGSPYTTPTVFLSSSAKVGARMLPTQVARVPLFWKGRAVSIFTFIVLLGLTSCSGCSRILGKVNKYVTEQAQKPRTAPPIDYAKEGVNTEHLFIFSDTAMTYNGKPFQIGMTIDEMCEILGKYDRMPEQGIYLWDSLGITITTWSEDDENTNKTNGILIDWNIHLNDWGLGQEYEDKELREICPRHYFKGKIIVGGAALGRGMQIDEFLKKTTLEFSNDPFPILYYSDLWNWDYSKAPISKEKYYTYMVAKSEDCDDIDGFNAAISTRGVGDPGFVLEYEE